MTFALPFLFVLAISYGALQIANVFRNKAVNAVIALVISFFAISNADLVNFIIQSMPWMAMIFIAVFFIKFILNMFKQGKGERDYTLLIIILGLVLIFLIGQGMQIIHDWLPGGFPITEENLIMIIGVGIIVAIFFSAYRLKGD